MSIYICPLGAMLAAIMFFWVAGKKFAEESVNNGADKPVGSGLLFLENMCLCHCHL